MLTDEMYVTRTALTKLLDNNGENRSYTIFSDSRSTLLAVKSWAGAFAIAEQIKTTTHHVEAKKTSVGFPDMLVLWGMKCKHCCKGGCNK